MTWFVVMTPVPLSIELATFVRPTVLLHRRNRGHLAGMWHLQRVLFFLAAVVAALNLPIDGFDGSPLRLHGLQENLVLLVEPLFLSSVGNVDATVGDGGLLRVLANLQLQLLHLVQPREAPNGQQTSGWG